MKSSTIVIYQTGANVETYHSNFHYLAIILHKLYALLSILTQIEGMKENQHHNYNNNVAIIFLNDPIAAFI